VSGRSNWQDENMADPSRAVATTYMGRNAWAIHIEDGDNVTGERAEFGQDSLPLRTTRAFGIGFDGWIGFAVNLPTGFPVNENWGAVVQWKDQPDLGSPSWGMYVQGGNIEQDGDIYGVLWSIPATLNTWHNFVVHLKVSTGSDGIFDLYHSTGNVTPALVMSKHDVTSRGSTWLIPRMGYYRDPTTTGTVPVYHAGWAVGTSFAVVNPAM
jgi:hypothetical protein